MAEAFADALEDVELNYEETITTCSHAASKMGSRQKVIAFTYFKGSEGAELTRKYEAGIFGNLEAIGQHYLKEAASEATNEAAKNEWSMRLYHNLEDDDVDLCHLACSNRNRGRLGEGLRVGARRPRLVLCNVNRNPLFGNASSILPTLWRFLPMLDDQVGKLQRIKSIKNVANLFYFTAGSFFREIWQRVISVSHFGRAKTPLFCFASF